MRIRATVVALSSALALSALAVPAAHAAGTGDTEITKVVVNGGSNVAVGTTSAKTFKVSITATDDSGIDGADFYLYGPSYGYLDATQAISCTASSATTSTCTGTFTVDPQTDFFDNGPAGTWYVDAWVDADDGDWFTSDKTGSFKMQRFSKLTANASPEPVQKGKTITVTGALTRANWETSKYAGYTGQSVKLQFRKKGTDTYTTVKTVTSGTGGAVKTTVTASVDGYYRWNFAGTSTTPAVKAAGDYVDVTS